MMRPLLTRGSRDASRGAMRLLGPILIAGLAPAALSGWIVEHAAPGAVFLLNSPHRPEEVWQHLPRSRRLN